MNLQLIINCYSTFLFCRIPQKDKACIVLCSQHSPVNIATHLNDVSEHQNIAGQVTRHGKSFLCLFADGGPDYNVNHAIDWYHHGQFFTAWGDLTSMSSASPSRGQDLKGTSSLWCSHGAYQEWILAQNYFLWTCIHSLYMCRTVAMFPPHMVEIRRI